MLLPQLLPSAMLISGAPGGEPAATTVPSGPGELIGQPALSGASQWAPFNASAGETLIFVKAPPPRDRGARTLDIFRIRGLDQSIHYDWFSL
jgi:hypothetical protein